MRSLILTVASTAILAGAAVAQEAADSPANGGSGGGADITVQQPAPEITVQQPAPDVTVTQPQPNITVEQPPPQVTVEQPEPNVTVEPQGQPNVTVEEQGQPDVNVQSEGQPDINVQTQGQRQGDQPMGGQEAATQGTQPMPADSQGAQPMPPAQQADTAPASDPAADNPLYGMSGTELIGQTLYGANGEQIGEVDNVVVSQQDGQPPAVLVGVGGFLGIGERDVAIPFDQLALDGNNRLMTSLTRDQIGQLGQYDEGSWRTGDPARPVGDQAAGG